MKNEDEHAESRKVVEAVRRAINDPATPEDKREEYREFLEAYCDPDPASLPTHEELAEYVNAARKELNDASENPKPQDSATS